MVEHIIIALVKVFLSVYGQVIICTIDGMW